MAWSSARLLTLAFIWLACLPLSTADHWSAWSSWSECSRTCDGGATYQERKCIRKYSRSRDNCEGERFRYNTCNNEPCSADAVDFRTQQCAAYNNATYGGKLYKWLPYTDRKNPCTLYCIPMGTRTVVRLAPEVLDGTRCKPNSYDMCISGKCWKVGCDHRLNSPLELDLCSVCGGNNSCLNNGTRGRYHWIKIGLSPCSASCGVGIQKYQYRCRDRLTGNQVPDSRCASLSKPNGREKSCYRRQCPPVWKIFPWQDCSVSCGGGVAKRAVRCMDTLRDGRQQWLHDSFCPYPKPAPTRSCNSHICPKWYAGEWSPCSVTCGWGEQVREVVCRHEGDTFCDVDTKPVVRRNCTTIFTCKDPNDPRYIAEHDETGRQELALGYRRSRSDDYLIINDKESHKYKDELRFPRFVVSDWGDCNATCGEAYRERYVRCQVFLPLLGDTVDMSDAECFDHKPPSAERCDVPPCYKDFRWERRGMTPCSRSCLGGTQETLLECVNKHDGKPHPSENCKYAPAVPIERRVCNDVPCPQIWLIGDFGECSTTCGGGLMKRDVQCVKQVDVSTNRVVNLPDVMCDQPVPQRTRKCNTQYCPANWASGFWSECSTTCGKGVELRPVVCQRVSPDGEPVDVDEYHCPPSERPVGERTCNVATCPEIKIKQKRMKFIQINKMKKVRLYAGAAARILHGTNLVLKCPVRGMNKRRIEWLKDGRRILPSSRVSTNSRGNLKIRRSSWAKDTGKYTCVAQHKTADVSIKFNNFMDILQETMQREKYLLGLDFVADQSTGNTTSYTIKDPFDRKRRPLQLVISDWSNCTASCGKEISARNISCEIITRDYFEIFPLRVCKKTGMSIPDSQKRCDLSPCTHWVTKEWSKCLDKKCVRDGYAVKVRSVSCAIENSNAPAHDEKCDSAKRPSSRKECRNDMCKAGWHVSKWSECIADCGETGFQTRMLTCKWKGSGLSAGRHCAGLPRPLLTRSCLNNCTHVCADETTYCNIIPQMKLCRYTNFKTKCCHSCNSMAEDPPS